MNGLEKFFNEHYSKLFIYTNYQLIYLITNWWGILFCIFSDVCMIGDDVRDDILGAQNVGFTVSTIKFFLKGKIYV